MTKTETKVRCFSVHMCVCACVCGRLSDTACHIKFYVCGVYVGADSQQQHEPHEIPFILLALAKQFLPNGDASLILNYDLAAGALNGSLRRSLV